MGAAFRWCRSGLPLRVRGVSWDLPTALLLMRSAFSALVVTLLGWRALLGQASYVAILTAMQANSTVGAWLACEMHRCGSRPRSPSPTVASINDDDTSTPASLGSGSQPRRTSNTLPRGWRYHKSTGLFEHKRTGRMQRQLPGETGSPLCNLPPCDEERALLLETASDVGSDRDSCSEGSKRAWRSRTWHDGVRKGSSRGTPMNLWELRAALESDGCAASYRSPAWSRDVVVRTGRVQDVV